MDHSVAVLGLTTCDYRLTTIDYCLASLLRHERILIVRRRRKRLFDRPRAHPANEIQLRPGLVVRPARSRATERLLAYHRARRLVVDVEVSGRVSEGEVGLLDGATIRREHGTGERVRRRLVDDLERLRPLVVVVDERRHHWAEDLLAHETVITLVGLYERRRDEVALSLIHISEPTRLLSISYAVFCL